MTTKQTPELKPCPFCGSNEINKTDLAIRDDDGEVCHYLCICPDCTVMQIPCDTKTEAIAAWNTRAPSAITKEEAVPRATADKLAEAILYAMEVGLSAFCEEDSIKAWDKAQQALNEYNAAKVS